MRSTCLSKLLSGMLASLIPKTGQDNALLGMRHCGGVMVQVWDLEQQELVSSLKWGSDITACTVIPGTPFL